MSNLGIFLFGLFVTFVVAIANGREWANDRSRESAEWTMAACSRAAVPWR